MLELVDELIQMGVSPEAAPYVLIGSFLLILYITWR